MTNDFCLSKKTFGVISEFCLNFVITIASGLKQTKALQHEEKRQPGDLGSVEKQSYID